MAHEARPAAEFVLPPEISGLVDVRRLRRELQTLDEKLLQLALDKTPVAGRPLPRASHLLEALFSANQCHLREPAERQQLAKRLDELEATAPRLHLSFAANPSAAFVQKLVAWLRANVHPLALVNIGLEPSIAAGCVLRTPNKQFDFSLRQHFLAHKDILITALQAGEAGAAA